MQKRGRKYFQSKAKKTGCKLNVAKVSWLPIKRIKLFFFFLRTLRTKDSTYWLDHDEIEHS